MTMWEYQAALDSFCTYHGIEQNQVVSKDEAIAFYNHYAAAIPKKAKK